MSTLQKINIKICAMFLFSIVFSCNDNTIEFGDSILTEKFKVMDMRYLTNKPLKFDNDTLNIIGELHLDLENKGLYNQDRKIWINSFNPATQLDSVWKKMNGKNVQIIGLYQSGKTGHLGNYDGQFKEVYYIKSE